MPREDEPQTIGCGRSCLLRRYAGRSVRSIHGFRGHGFRGHGVRSFGKDGMIPFFTNKVTTKDAKSGKEDEAYPLQIFASFALFVVTSLLSF